VKYNDDSDYTGFIGRQRTMTEELLTAAGSEPLQRATASLLAEKDLSPGDRVAILHPNSADVVSAVLGALRVGVVPIVLDPAMPVHERDAVFQDARPSLVIDSPDRLAWLTRGPADSAPRLAPIPLARPLHYTSGTSGRRKGVWSGLLSEDCGRALVEEETELWGFTADDIHLVSSLLYHSAPLRFAMYTLLAGGSVAVLPKFTMDVWSRAVEHWRPSTTFLAPAHLQRIQEAALAGDVLPDLSMFRLVAYAGAPCSRPLQDWAHRTFPDSTVWEFYGSTEGQFTACSPEDFRTHPGSVGKARPGRRLEIDKEGVVWCHVPEHARFSYWDDGDKTARAWRGAAFSVGDIGRLDESGYLYLEGRRDDLILSGGVNVYPREVELALERCPGVADVVVTARLDDRWGERVVAVVVGTASEGELREWAAAELSPPRRPKEYLFAAVIPRTANGKVLRRQVLTDLGLAP
jgi:long-chain acyl-CoA synthetase